MNSMNIKTGDTVIVLSGKDKGKKGKVITAMPSVHKVIVENVNVAKKHHKPRKQGETGGIISKEIPIASCKVMLVCGKCSKPTRAAHKIENNKSIRVCKHCGQAI